MNSAGIGVFSVSSFEGKGGSVYFELCLKPSEREALHLMQCSHLAVGQKGNCQWRNLCSCSLNCSEADTSTAILKSIIETLVFLCQQTCTVVLPRCGDWRSREVRDALRSSSDSWSTVVSSGDSMKCREKASFLLYTTYIIGKVKQGSALLKGIWNLCSICKGTFLHNPSVRASNSHWSILVWL